MYEYAKAGRVWQRPHLDWQLELQPCPAWHEADREAAGRKVSSPHTYIYIYCKFQTTIIEDNLQIFIIEDSQQNNPSKRGKPCQKHRFTIFCLFNCTIPFVLKHAKQRVAQTQKPQGSARDLENLLRNLARVCRSEHRECRVRPFPQSLL